MLFIDNDELEIIEYHIILDDRMCSDQGMNPSFQQILFDLIFLWFRYWSRKQFDSKS